MKVLTLASLGASAVSSIAGVCLDLAAAWKIQHRVLDDGINSDELALDPTTASHGYTALLAQQADTQNEQCGKEHRLKGE